jgi:hypothetical protein
LYLYKPAVKQTQEEFNTEWEIFEEKEKTMGRIIGIINKRKNLGTYECRHNIEDKWSSMRVEKGETGISKQVCQKCGFAIFLG